MHKSLEKDGAVIFVWTTRKVVAQVFCRLLKSCSNMLIILRHCKRTRCPGKVLSGDLVVSFDDPMCLKREILELASCGTCPSTVAKP